MRNKGNRIMQFLLLALSVAVLTACRSELEKTVDRVKETKNYSMTLTLHEMHEAEDVTISYSQEGDIQYYDIKFRSMRESYYDVDNEDGHYRYSQSQGQWNRTSVDPEEDPLIKPDSIYLRPMALSEDYFESTDDDGIFRLKDASYEDLFGTKAEAVQNVTLMLTDETIEFEYGFTQDNSIIDVSGIIEDIDDTEITLPFE